MIQQQPDNQNENQSLNQNQNIVQPIDNNQSQLLTNQAVDPELYPTMKKVIETSKEKIHFDKKQDEGEKREGEEDSLLKHTSTATKRIVDYEKIYDEFRDIFNKENSNINNLRRWLIHIIIFTIVLNCCALEGDCLYLNVCYGENIEMESWISISLFPLIIVSILLLYLLYSTINYLKKTAFIVCAIIYLFLSVYCIILAIFSFYYAFRRDDSEIENKFNSMTDNEKYYYQNDENEVYRAYKIKMIWSGSFNLVLGFFGIIIFIISLLFNTLLLQTTYDWRPPLRSHVRISRIKKSIELYAQNIDSFTKIFRAENPNYQLDELENKDMNRFGIIKGSIGDSADISKERKDVSNINNSGNINNINNNEEIILPKALKKKNKVNIVDNKDEKNNEDNQNNNINNENEINTNTNNLINNNIENENEINTNSNNLINNKINNENEINTDKKDEL